MSTFEKILLVVGFAIGGGALYALIELVYHLWKYKPKNQEQYKKAFEQIIKNSEKLVNLKTYEIENVKIIVTELENDTSSFKKDLGFIAKRDMSALWAIRNKILSMLKQVLIYQLKM